MAAAVAAHDVQHGNGAGPGHQRGAGRGERGGDAGRNPVGHVVHPGRGPAESQVPGRTVDRKSTRLNSSHPSISYAVFFLEITRPVSGSPQSHVEMRPAVEAANP